MDVVLWIIAGVLAAVFLVAGGVKLARPKAELREAGMHWVDLTSEAGVKAVGALEVLGALGLVLPAALDIAPVLVPIAATGLAIVMAGAVATHVRMDDTRGALPAAVLLVLSVVVAVLRSGPYAF